MQEVPAKVGLDLANWTLRQAQEEGGAQICAGTFRGLPEPQQLPELPPSTRGQALHRLGFVLKRPQKRLLKADAAKRETFVAEYAALVDEAQQVGAKVFFVDEAHFRADADLRGKWVLRVSRPWWTRPARAGAKRPAIIRRCAWKSARWNGWNWRATATVKRTGHYVPIVEGRDVWWHDLVVDLPLTCEPEQMDSEDMLFMLYTSGTTGKPKGHRPYHRWIHDRHLCHQQVNLRPEREDDVYWRTADIGWVTGHSYIIYGPLSNGATTVMYEGSPDYPDRDRLWAIVEKYACTICFTAPTAIQTFMRWGEEYSNRHDMSSLRLLRSVGEPINPEAWVWYWQHIGGGRYPVVDTWWQTETGSVMISALTGITTLKPGSTTQPFPCIDAAILDEQGNEIGPSGGGYLIVRKPWPSMLRGIYGDPERFVQQYWSNYEGIYFTSDGAKLGEESYFWLLGRVDNVINVSAHPISTMEVESVLVCNLKVAETECIGRSHEVKGQAIVAFVTLKDQVAGSDDVITELKQHVAGKIGPMAHPDDIYFAAELPKDAAARSCVVCSATWPRAARWATPPRWPIRWWWRCLRSSTGTRTSGDARFHKRLRGLV